VRISPPEKMEKNFEKKKPKREKIEVKTNQQKNCVTFYFILFYLKKIYFFRPKGYFSPIQVSYKDGCLGAEARSTYTAEMQQQRLYTRTCASNGSCPLASDSLAYVQ
jgi:hypothetical protein